MAKLNGKLLVFSLLLIFVYSKPLKRKQRDSDTITTVEEVKEETVKEETNETFLTVLTKFNDFYADILPELSLTPTYDLAGPEVRIHNYTNSKQELSLTSSLDCLTLNATGCAESLKKQFNQKVKDEYVREIMKFISQTSDYYTAVLEQLPKHDPHTQGIRNFLNLIVTDSPKLNSSIDLSILDAIYRTMENTMKPNFSNAEIDDASKAIYEDILCTMRSKRPSVQEINKSKVAYINKIWNELFEDLRAVDLFKRL